MRMIQRCLVLMICFVYSAVAQAESVAISAVDNETFYLSKMNGVTDNQILDQYRSEIFARSDIEIKDKIELSQKITDQFAANLDAAYEAEVKQIWGRGAATIILNSIGYNPLVPGAVGGALTAWADGIDQRKSAQDIMGDMVFEALTGGLMPKALGKLLGKAAPKLTKNVGKYIEKNGKKVTGELLDKVTSTKIGQAAEAALKESKNALRTKLNSAINKITKEFDSILRKPDDKLGMKDRITKQAINKLLKELKDFAADVKTKSVKDITREVLEDRAKQFFDDLEAKLDSEIRARLRSYLLEVFDQMVEMMLEANLKQYCDTYDPDTVVLEGYVHIDEYRSTDDGTYGKEGKNRADNTATNGGGNRNSPSSDTTSHSSTDNGTAKRNTPDAKDTPQQQQYYEYIPETDSKVNDGGGKDNGSLNQKGPSNDGGTPFELSPQVEKIYKPNSRTDDGTNQQQNGNGHGSENGSVQNNTGINNDSTNPQKNSDGGSVPFELSPQVEKVVHPDQNNNASGNDNNTSNNNDGNSQNSEQTQNADGQTNPPQNNNGQAGGNGGTSDNGVNGTGNAGTVDGSGSTNDGAGGAAANNQKRPLIAGTKDDFVSMPTTISNVSDVDNLDMDPLAKQILKEYLTGESNVLPPDFIPGAFGSLSTDVKDQKTIMQEAYAGEIAKIVGNDTAEKGALTQAIEDFVNGGNGNDMKSFEDMLSQTVDPSRKDKILSLTEAFKTVDQDGGKSLIEKMGADGQAVTDSLIINEIKKQIGDVLPKDVADEVNGLLGTLDNKNLSKNTKAKILEQVQKLVGKAVPEHSADAINSILQKVIDGTSMQTLDEAKNLGKGIGADVLKGVIEKNLDPKLAKELNALIDGYMKNGAQGLTDAAKKELEALIDQYAPGSNAAALLKNAVNGIVSGQANPTTWKDVATSVVADAANKLIDESNLPPDVKKAAKEAVNGLAQNGLTGLTANMQQFITDYVTDKLGKDAGEAAGKIFNAIVTPGVDPWQEIVNQAPVIGAAVGQKFLDEAEKLIGKQIDKLIDKCPALKLVLGKLGVDGKGIIHGVVNVIGVLVSAPDLQTAIAQLSIMGLNFLKNVAAKLIDWALEWAVSWINNNLVPKVLDWASETLGKWADSAKAGGLIQRGLEWLQQQCQNCKKCGGIKINTAGTGKKVVDWIEGKIKAKSSPGTTVLTSP